jgi:hypothetical protein
MMTGRALRRSEDLGLHLLPPVLMSSLASPILVILLSKFF